MHFKVGYNASADVFFCRQNIDSEDSINLMFTSHEKISWLDSK